MEKAVLNYVDLVSMEPEKIDQSTFDGLRKYLSEEDLVELTTFLFFNLGFHTFFGSLKFYPMFSPDGRLVDQEESERLYGASPGSLQDDARVAAAGDD